MSSDYELSIDDLVDLLHSVDHEKIVDSENAVISDGALAALLDRTLQGDKATEEDAEGTLKGAGSIAHSGVFKIIAERDSSGKLVGEHSTEDIVCAGGPSTGGSVDTESGDAGSAEIVTGSAGGGDLDTKSGAGTPEMVGLDSPSGCGVGGVVGAAETASGGDLNIGCPAVMSATEDLPSESATPEPSSSGSLKSSSSLSIGSSSGSDSVQSMDTDAGTPASSLVLTGSSSPTPEPAAGGVVVADTEVKVCAGEMKMQGDMTVSSAAAGSLMTS